jgi:hypothetical protein
MIDPEVQSSNGVLLLQRDNTWSGNFSYVKLFSQNKARQLCNKMNKRAKEYGENQGKPYPVYHIIENYESSMIRKVYLFEYILHKFFDRHVIRCSDSGVYYCRICGKHTINHY